MTFSYPTEVDNHETALGSSDPRWLANIGTPTRRTVKPAGNLPISQGAKQYQNTTSANLEGWASEFQASQAAYDVSTNTKIAVWHIQFNSPVRIQIDTVANGGVRFRLYSGTGSPPTVYRDFYLGGYDTPFGNCERGPVPFVVDLNDATHDASSGTFDNTDVTSYACLTYSYNMSGTNSNYTYPTKLWVFDTTKTSSSTPTFSGASSTFDDAVTAVQGSSYTNKYGNWVRQIGNAYFIDVAFRIGDASTATTFNDSGYTIVSPPANDSDDPRYRITTQACRVYVYLRNNAADTATFSGTWLWGTRAAFDFSQSDSASITFSGATFSGMGDFDIGSSVSGDATFDDVGVVDMDPSADLDGSIFRNPYGNHLLSIG